MSGQQCPRDGRPVVGSAWVCVSPCDPDCESDCHEWHEVPWKRQHDPDVCEAMQEIPR